MIGYALSFNFSRVANYAHPSVNVGMTVDQGKDRDWLMRIESSEWNSITDYMVWQQVKRLSIGDGFTDQLKKYGTTVKILSGIEACESRLLTEPMENYGLSILYIVHGIVNERLPYLQQAALLLSNPVVIKEPLKIKISGREYEIDGFLTMSEVMEQKLATELVGALACHTGEGGILPGEGVMNLGRAFQYAGARSVLVSLWAVSGESTVLQIEWILEAVYTGKSKDKAILEARKKLRQSGYEHPFYWASLILIGERDFSALVLKK